MISLEEQRQVIRDLTDIMGADVKRLYAAITTSLVAEQLSSVTKEKREGIEADIANQIIYFEVLKNYIGVDEAQLNKELHKAFGEYKRFIDDNYKNPSEAPVLGGSILGADMAGGKEPTLSESLEELNKVMEEKPASEDESEKKVTPFEGEADYPMEVEETLL